MSEPEQPKCDGHPAPSEAGVPTAPVALFVFNRPALTRDAMARLAALRPPVLLVVADGPRSSAEADRCRQTREAVRQGLNWEAEALFLESDVNLGCRRRLESGLDWVFSKVDRAIVLEDDIEASPAFFRAASLALERLEKRPDVRMLSGHNVIVEWPFEPRPFLASAGSIWGWATWADRWQAYRRGFAALQGPGHAQAFAPLREGISRHAGFEVQRRLQTHLLDTAMWLRIDTWDIPWSLWNLATGGLCCTLPRNQCTNHGIGPDATHTTAQEDIRGCLPLIPWEAQPGDFDAPPLREAYARGKTLLELVMNYEAPRRWKLLARSRDRLPRAVDGPGWDIMLAPFDHAAETGAWIARLGRSVGGRQIQALAEVFPALQAAAPAASASVATAATAHPATRSYRC